MFSRLAPAVLCFLCFSYLGCYPERQTPELPEENEEGQPSETEVDAGQAMETPTEVPDAGQATETPTDQEDGGQELETPHDIDDAGQDLELPPEQEDAGQATETPPDQQDAGTETGTMSDAGQPHDPCQENPCGEHASCENAGSTFLCLCNEGYFENDGECVVVTDCAPGEFISNTATNSSDRTCEACPGFAPTILSSEIIAEGTVNTSTIRIDPTSQHVAYHGDGTTDTFDNIYASPIAGGPWRPMDSRSQEDSFYILYGDYQWTSDGQYLIYQDTQLENSIGRLLFRSAINGDPAVTQLATNGPGSLSFRINSTSSEIVYHDENGKLHSAPITGEEASQLGSDLATNSDKDFLISPDGQKVVYRTRPNNITQLFSIDIKGETSPVELTTMETTIIISEINQFEISPDGNFVVFSYKKNSESWDELYSVPITGGAPKRLNGNFVGAPNIPDIYFKISPNSEFVAYLADENNSGVRDLYTANIDESNTSFKTSSADDVGGEIFEDFQVSLDGSLITYRGEVTIGGAINLFTSIVDLAESIPMINPLCSGCHISHFRLHSETNQVAYRTTYSDGSAHLFLVNNGSYNGAQISQDMDHDTNVYDDFRFSASGQILFYSAKQESTEQRDLYAHFFERNTYRRINDAYPANHLIWNWEVSPDDKKIVYIVGPVETANTKHVYSAFVEGGTFSSDANQNSCNPWAICSESEYITAQGTTNSDQTCGSCAADQEPGYTNADSCLTDNGGGDDSSGGNDDNGNIE